MWRSEVTHPWREVLRSLWFMPMLFIVAALGSGYGLSHVDLPNQSPLDSLIFQGSATAARELLIVVSGTMITVTGLVFVLTVVAIQIASTQFSPRLLRSFLQDLGTRLVLSVFVATFAYSLGGLFTVGQSTEDGAVFVPRVAVTGSLVLALLSVGMLVYYIQHITNSIRIDTVMLGVRNATTRAIRFRFTKPVAADGRPPTVPVPPSEASIIVALRSGYVQDVDAPRLLELARQWNAGIQLRAHIGQHVVAGTPLAWVWTRGGAETGGQGGESHDLSSEPGEFDWTPLVESVNRAVERTQERRVEDDVGFGVRQLVDIGLRAIAPSVNDPYTAVQAVQHLSIVIADLATLATDHELHVEHDRVVLFVPVPGFELFLDVICMNLRRNAGDRPRVMVELLRLLETAAVVTPSHHRRSVIAGHIELIMGETRRRVGTESDRSQVRSQARRATSAAETGFMTPMGQASDLPDGRHGQ